MLGRFAGSLWLVAALGVTLLFMSRTMAPAFGRGDVVQDDARQHVFWMLRFRDPELFRDDLMADYYESVAPAGYRALYWALSPAIDPTLASKLLPLPLGLAAALFLFLTVWRLYPSPPAAFLATVLLSRYAWQHAALASGTPRAFLLPLLTALVWALVTRRLAVAVGVTGLAALFYPVGAVLGLALLGLRLVSFSNWRPVVTHERRDWVALVVAMCLVAAVLVPSELLSSSFGPMVTGQQARAMPEFGEDGHSAFFLKSPYEFWLKANRSGLDLSVLDARFRAIPILYEHAALAALLPLALLLRRRLPGMGPLSAQITVVPRLLFVSFALFLLAHLLIFYLYLPGRYVKWTVPIALSISAGVGIAMLLDGLAHRFSSSRRVAVAYGLALFVGLIVSLYPGRYQGKFLPDPNPSLTAYLRGQPKDLLIAGVPSETDSIPALTGRRVLATREYALPYHLGYYEQVRQRLLDLIDAYYAESPREVAEFANRYGVDLLLVNRTAFDRTRFTNAWGSDFEPYGSHIAGKLGSSTRFALLEAASRCRSQDAGGVLLVPVSCLTNEH